MGTLNEDLTAIKAVEDKLTANKVANFAYTNHAYNNPLTEADGVETYDVNNEQNIPVANASIMKVNQTILTKGWRSQASSITRMLMNHFLGRCSYNLNKINDLMSSLLSTLMSHLGTANGLATLDANGRIPYSQLPESAVELKGYWNADTNTPTLADGTGTNGDEYLVSDAGTQDLGSGSQYFGVGDRVVYTGGVWKNISSGFVRTVSSVAPDAQGNVALAKGDVGLGNVANTGDSDTPVASGTDKFTTGGAFTQLDEIVAYFDPSQQYVQDDIVRYNNGLWKANKTHSGAWNSIDFDFLMYARVGKSIHKLVKAMQDFPFDPTDGCYILDESFFVIVDDYPFVAKTKPVGYPYASYYTIQGWLFTASGVTPVSFGSGGTTYTFPNSYFVFIGGITGNATSAGSNFQVISPFSTSRK